jgi:hypothetical protein
LECDLDLPPETAYKAYDKRWEVEILQKIGVLVAPEPLPKKRGRPKKSAL